jgi:hypothetical protein
VTHEYVIATGGRILAAAGERSTTEPASSAIAWTAGTILAIGADPVVRAISRGDSTFVDLAGALVTAWSGVEGPLLRAARAGCVVDGRDGAMAWLESLLATAGATGLEVGGTADLGFWRLDRRSDPGPQVVSLRLVATTRDGHFTEGDPHSGPFG